MDHWTYAVRAAWRTGWRGVQIQWRRADLWAPNAAHWIFASLDEAEKVARAHPWGAQIEVIDAPDDPSLFGRCH